MRASDRLLTAAYFLALPGFYGLMVLAGRWSFGITGLVWISTVHLATQWGLLLGFAPWRYGNQLSPRRRMLAGVAAGLVIAVPTGIPAGFLVELAYESLTASVGPTFAFPGIVLLTWTVWSGILTRRWATQHRYAALRQLLAWIGGCGVALSLFGGVIWLEYSPHELAKVPLIVGLYLLVWPLGPALLCWICRGRLEPRGRCPACGYDLLGLSQMRCPECGRAFTFEEVHATAEELRVVGDGAER